MSLTQQPHFPFTGGINRSVSSRVSDHSTFYDLLGLRQSPTAQGILETAPYFHDGSSHTRGTYYASGSSQTEPASSKVLGSYIYKYPSTYLANNYTGTHSSYSLMITDYTTLLNGSQIQTFFQTVQPVANNLNTGCYLYINNAISLAITLGNTIDVVIDGATTFKWRKNGGTYTTLVPITTAGVSIDSGNATVYFLTATGFTIADTWTWQRTDASQTFPTNGSGRACVFVQCNATLFFTNPSKQIMVLQTNSAGSPVAVVSAGYRPIYGAFLAYFDDHLIVGNFSVTSFAATLTGNSVNTIGWSDKTDLNSFFSTDVNEADSATLPVNDDAANDFSALLGVFVIQQQLYVLVSQGLFYTPALGLPIVFSFQRFLTFPSHIAPANTFSVCPGNGVIYIVNEFGPWTFNGTSFTYIGRAIRNVFWSAATQPEPVKLFTLYNSLTQELLWYDGSYLYTYQEGLGTFYRRYADFVTAVSCLGLDHNTSGITTTLIGTASLGMFYEDINFSRQPDKDFNAGASFGSRKLITHAYVGTSIVNTKEIISTYLSAEVDTVASVNYAVGNLIKATLSWYLSATGILGSSTTDTNATWTSASVDGMISYPRTSFKSCALELALSPVSGTLPVGRIYIADLQPVVSNTETPR